MPSQGRARQDLGGVEQEEEQEDEQEEEQDDDDDGFSAVSARSPYLALRHSAGLTSPLQYRFTPARQPAASPFSPRRKGDRLLPGGLAATVRSWVLDLAEPRSRRTATALRPSRPESRSASPSGCLQTASRLRVERVHHLSVAESGAALVHASDLSLHAAGPRSPADAPYRVVLLGAHTVVPGQAISLDRSWVVEVDGLESWTVALDWHAL